MVQLIFSSPKDTIRILMKRGLEGVEKVFIFDVWYFDEVKRKMREALVQEVEKYLESANLKHETSYLDISRGFHEIVIQIAGKVNCNKESEFYLTSNEIVVDLAFYYFAILCKKAKVFDKDFREILLALPERVSKAQLEVLYELREEKEIEKLVKTLGKSLPTLSKQISALEEKGLVVCKEGRPKKCVITKLGEILLALTE